MDKLKKGHLVKVALQTSILDDPKIRMAIGGLLGASIGGANEWMNTQENENLEKERGRRLLLKALEGGMYGAGIGGLSSMFGPNVSPSVK